MFYRRLWDAFLLGFAITASALYFGFACWTMYVRYVSFDSFTYNIGGW